MTPERWRQIRTVFDSAVELPLSQVEPFLQRTCGDDAELYTEVRRMVNEHQRSGLLDYAPVAAAAAPAGSPPVFQAGQIVSARYRIVRYLSRGGMGEVYEAQDLELSGTVALKTLLPAIAEDEAMIARFKQEIALSRRIAHPNVCKVFDLDKHEEDGQHPVVFLSMEFLDGETLAAKLQREGPMSEAAALPVLRQVGEALDAAHEAGVIHRDLKPSNVMLAPSSDGVRAVVTDFGLARSYVPSSGGATATISNMLVGTLDYMAPELLTGSAASFGSDVYALGMMAYKMVTGALPFATDTPLAGAILRSKQACPSPRTLVAGLDPQWEQAILRAVDADPGKRFSQARHFLQALSGESVSMTVRLPVMTRRRVLAAGVAAVLTIGGIFLWNSWQDARHRISPEARTLFQKGVDDIYAGAYFAASKALEQAAQLAPHDAKVHARLAEAYMELDMADSARGEMLVVRRQDLSRLSNVERLQIEGVDLEITRDYGQAAAKFEEMARISGGGTNVDLDLGRAYEKAGRVDAASKSYLRAAEGPDHSPAAWLRLGVLYARQNEAKSKEAFQKAQQGYELTSNLEGLTELAIQEGLAANTRGQLPEAAKFLQKALDTARLAGNFQQEINATLRLSTTAYLSGDAAATERYARSGLEAARSHQLNVTAARGLLFLGNAYHRRQDAAGAEKQYREALDLARQNRAVQTIAASQLALAVVHLENNRGEEASREAQDALNFYQPNKYEKESLQCVAVMARVKRDAGDQEGALAAFRDLMRRAEAAGDAAQTRLGREGIGTILFSQDRFPEALEVFQQNLNNSVDAEPRGYASMQCANQLWRLGRYGEADNLYAKAEAIGAKFKPLLFAVMEGRSDELLSLRQFAQAADQVRRTRQLIAENDTVSQAVLGMLLAKAMLGQGLKSQGSSLAEQAWAALKDGSQTTDILLSRVAVLQARLASRDLGSAVQIFQEIDKQLAGKPELRWRTLALLSRSDPRYEDPAREARQRLSQLWGESTFRVYLSRPDVQELSRPLLGSNPALH